MLVGLCKISPLEKKVDSVKAIVIKSVYSELVDNPQWNSCEQRP